MTTVKFLLNREYEGAFPRPVPAAKKIPDYFKRVPPMLDKHNPFTNTVKRCMPFLDAMTQGFIIPLWADVFVRAKEGDLTVSFPRFFPMPTSLEPHNYQQISDHPLSDTAYGKMPLKFISPWIIQTPPGYSCLFTSPLNHMETRLKLLDGVVDTDEYYNNVNSPFIWTGGDGEFNIPKGTPLIHIIPFKREVYSAEYGEIDESRRGRTIATLGTVMSEGYKKLYRHGGEASTSDHEFEIETESPTETEQVTVETRSQPEHHSEGGGGSDA